LNKILIPTFIFIIQNLAFFFCFGLFLLLLARNPFSSRTLIAVMDPFPDTIHYTNSAFSFLRGKGYVLEREGRIITADVPPLYSFTLIPSFLIFNDVRAFYFTNVLLAIISFILFYRIILRFFSHKSVQFLVLFSYATCLPITWYTSLAMAENLILPLFLFALFIVSSNYSWKKAVLMAVVCISFYATKYASIPLLFSFALIYFIKIFSAFNIKNNKYKHAGFFLVVLLLFGTMFELFEYKYKGTGIVTQILPLFKLVFLDNPKTILSQEATQIKSFFSTDFILLNIKSYLSWFLGGKIYILWSLVQITSPIWAVQASLGLFFGLARKKWRPLAFSLLFSQIVVLGFMMSFYTTDGRYFYTAIPTVFLGLGFFLSSVVDFFNKKSFHWISYSFLVLVAVVLLMQNILPLKSAIMLNLRHAETPWPYISIQRLNVYLKVRQVKNQIPVVISPLSPYYVDFFKTEKMILLPLSLQQEARTDQKKVWGNYDFKHLDQVYTDFLMQNVPVYFASYGIGNDTGMNEARKNLESKFNLQEVDVGCLNVCTIYQLQLKKELN